MAIEQKYFTCTKRDQRSADTADEINIRLKIKTQATKTPVMRRVPQPLHRKHHDLLRTKLLHALCNVRDDQRIGEDREMRSVLLERSERDHENSSFESGEIG